MSFRTDDERILLHAFLAWLAARSWVKLDDPDKQLEIVEEFLKERVIK